MVGSQNARYNRILCVAEAEVGLPVVGRSFFPFSMLYVCIQRLSFSQRA